VKKKSEGKKGADSYLISGIKDLNAREKLFSIKLEVK